MNQKEQYGAYTPDFLVFSTNPPTDTKTVKLKGGQGVLERGTVIAFGKDAVGEAGLAWEDVTNQVADCVLCDDVDTGTDDTVQVTGHAYRVGHLSRQALKFGKTKTELTPEAEQQLQYTGILLSNTML